MSGGDAVDDEDSIRSSVREAEAVWDMKHLLNIASTNKAQGS
jgi:hypothetical protein